MCEKQEQLSNSLSPEELDKISEAVERMEAEIEKFQLLRELSEESENN